jgi:hypothetical protein
MAKLSVWYPAFAENILFYLLSGGTVFEPAMDPVTKTIPHIRSNGLSWRSRSHKRRDLWDAIVNMWGILSG